VLKKCTLLFVLFSLFFPTSVTASSVTSDPQYLIMNFSTINELDWAAPEEEWQTEVKPKIITELDALLLALPKDNQNRQLAWSTLMEYMNYPLDEPSLNSAYVVKTRRIFEIAEEKNIPVFLPLNGFQWWDELPELYNWWDPDGTQTPAVFFDRQDNPEDFKDRFIAGYDPNNKWNVEWQDWQTPMKLNWRNWGGGGFRLAPPPNITKYSRADQTYRQVLESRLSAILKQVENSVLELERKNKNHLFVGVSLGTELSLNASATPKDEFMPYGYRAIQDTVCQNKNQVENCLQPDKMTDELQTLRSKIVAQHLQELSLLAARIGLPKQRIYTHVWGEAGPEDPKYAPYAEAAFNLYARPGISLYGFAEEPQKSPTWAPAITGNGQPAWGAVEYSLPKNLLEATNALQNTLNSPEKIAPAKIIVIYNWSEHKNTPAIPALQKFLKSEPVPEICNLPEAIPLAQFVTHQPTIIEWQILEPEEKKSLNIHSELKLYRGLSINQNDTPIVSQPIEVGSKKMTLPPLKSGVYSWTILTTGCENKSMVWSQPRIITVPLEVETILPRWVNLALKFL